MKLILHLFLFQLAGAVYAQAPALAPINLRDMPVAAPATVEGVPAFAQALDSWRSRLRAAGLDPQETDRVYEMASLIRSKYIKRIDEDTLLRNAYEGAMSGKVPGSRLYSALKGMAGDIDPYTEFMTPSEYKRYVAYYEGTTASNGFLFADKDKDGPLKVLEVYPNGPADRAGLKSGDEVIGIEGRSVIGLTGTELDRLYPEGGAGTITRFRVRRGSAEYNVTLARAEIAMADIYCAMLSRTAGYIQIRGFHNETDSHLKNALAYLKGKGMTQLVVDLRDNPGGRIGSTVRAASVFLSRGKTVVQIIEGQDKSVATVEKDGGFADLPMAVLVDEYSASASELFAAAMQDNGRASLIGSRTFGKGIGQDTTTFDDKSALKLTALKWLTPSGTDIHGRGLDPDTAVRTSAADKIKIQRRLYRQITAQDTDEEMDPVLRAAFR